MACGSCKNRAKLFKRTVSNIVSTIKQNKTSHVTVTPSVDKSCSIKVKLKSTGYVAECSTHGTVGEPSPVPDKAKVECNNGK